MRLYLLLLIACSNQTDSPPKVDGGQVVLDPAGAEEQYVATTTAGERIEGELIATYEQPGQHVCALYTPQFADQPVRFIAPCDLRTFVTVARPDGFHSFGAMLDERRIGLASPLVGTATILVGNDCQHRLENGASSFAWDLVRSDVSPTIENGCPHVSVATLNEVYDVWHNAVVAPISGVVDEVESDVPDHAPGTFDVEHPSGNFVTIKVQDLPLSIALLHLARASIPRPAHVDPHTGFQVASTCAPEVPDVLCVTPGAAVAVGEVIGRVGDSGDSALPHLHIGAQWSAGARSWSVPVAWRDIYVTPDGPIHDQARPTTGSQVSGQPF